jgi:hypothetical protein
MGQLIIWKPIKVRISSLIGSLLAKCEEGTRDRTEERYDEHEAAEICQPYALRVAVREGECIEAAIDEGKNERDNKEEGNLVASHSG